MKEVKLIISIDQESNTEIEAQGFSDGACIKETEDLERSLGVVKARKRTNHGVTSSTGTKIKTGS